MNIAFLTSEYVTELDFAGGLANYLYRVGQGMKERGHHIEIFTFSDKNESINHQGIVVHRVRAKNYWYRFVNRYTRGRFKDCLHILSLSYFLRKRLLKRHREVSFDIIQSSSYLACGLFSTFFRPAPVVTRVSSYEPLMREFYQKQLTIDQRCVEYLEVLALRRSNAVYTPSKLLSDIVKERTKINAVVLRPPFTLGTDNYDESFYQTHLAGKQYFIFVGTIGFLKGGEVLAHCLPELLSQYPEMHFVFVGKDFQGPGSASMMHYILKNVGIHANQIIYLGVLRPLQLYPIVKHAHAVVLPSLIDNLPSTLSEAMALGKVVIGTSGTSFEELIEDGISGILVAPSNSRALCEAMDRVWNMGVSEREEMGKAAQRRVALLAPEKMCYNLEQYFSSIIKIEPTLYKTT